MDREGNIIREWMKEVMDKKDWSAEHWARLAETSPTNITRFMKDSKHVPSNRTIAKLARVAGSQPILVGRQLTAVKDIPTYSELHWLIENGQRVSPEEVVRVVGDYSNEAFGWRVPAGTGFPDIRHGDLLLCEPVEVVAPHDGDLVIYCDQGEPVVGRFVGGRIVTGIGDVIRATVLAVVVGLQRSLR